MTTAVTTPYRAIFCDLLTDQTIDILPIRDVTLDDYIGKPGSLSGTIPIPDAAMAARVRRIEEGRTSVYLERGGDLWWGGIIWTSTLQTSDRGVLTLTIQAATFDSYAARRRIRVDTTFPPAGSTAPVDQLEIVRQLWTQMQAAPGGNIGVTYGSESSTVTRTATWLDGDETLYSDAMAQFASLQDGFESYIAVYSDPATGKRVRMLRLGSPKITTGSAVLPTPSAGAPADGADLVLDWPGSILSYSFPRDATRGGTTAVARGASTNTNQAADSRPLYSPEAVAQPLIGAGYPRIDLSQDYNSVSDMPTLTALAAAELAAAQGAVVIPAITVRLDGMVPPALLGRIARIRITDNWFAEGLDAAYRIIGVSVTPAERGRPDTAELYLEAA